MLWSYGKNVNLLFLHVFCEKEILFLSFCKEICLWKLPSTAISIVLLWRKWVCIFCEQKKAKRGVPLSVKISASDNFKCIKQLSSTRLFSCNVSHRWLSLEKKIELLLCTRYITTLEPLLLFCYLLPSCLIQMAVLTYSFIKTTNILILLMELWIFYGKQAWFFFAVVTCLPHLKHTNIFIKIC